MHRYIEVPVLDRESAMEKSRQVVLMCVILIRRLVMIA